MSDTRIALVTGANKGIGFEIARALGRDHGMTVLIGARDEERGERPSGLPVGRLEETFATNVFGVVAVTNAVLPLLRAVPDARIVNVSSGLGSLAFCSDPNHMYRQNPLLAYNASKSALNAVTLAYAAELRGTGIKVNAADPGYCATDLNGHSGPRTPEQGAIAAVRLATLPAGGPTGGFFDEDGPVPW